jgi:hypothetical protein
MVVYRWTSSWREKRCTRLGGEVLFVIGMELPVEAAISFAKTIVLPPPLLAKIWATE